MNKKSIIEAVDGSLQRLGTDHIDVYQTHWPARYSPQSNWGQSLAYKRQNENERFCRSVLLPSALQFAHPDLLPSFAPGAPVMGTFDSELLSQYTHPLSPPRRR